MNARYYILLFCYLLLSCKKIYFYPDRDLGTVNTMVLAHAGGGNCPYKINTLDAVKYGLAYMDGVEVDVQLSEDMTVWLGHDSNLPACSASQEKCFRETSDNEIVQLDSCIGNGEDFTRLEEVFKYMAENYPNKYISIDVKAWSPCGISNLNVLGEMNDIADRIIQLKNKYKLTNILVESQTATFLNYLKDNSFGIECYLTTWGDFERGMLITLKKNLNGISFKYKYKEAITADHVRMLHKKGIKIQLWTVDDPADLEEAISLDPDFIQTDNTEYFINPNPWKTRNK